MRKLALIFCFTVMIGLVIYYTESQPAIQADDHTAMAEASPAAHRMELTDKEIQAVMNGLMDTMKQEANEMYRLVNYSAREELIQAFETYATSELAEKFVDTYFYTKADGVYLIPEETFPWFQEKTEYDMINTSKNTVELIQENEDDMFGKYTLAVTLVFQNGWKIKDIDYK